MVTIELHRHIDLSFRASTLAERSRELNLRVQFQNEDEVKEKYWFTSPMTDLSVFLERIKLCQHLLVDEESFERLAYEATMDAVDEGLEAIEFRYSPAFASGVSKLPWEKGLCAFQRGIKRATAEHPIKVGLIGIITREFEGTAKESMDFFIEHKDDYCGVDLAGDEGGVPTKNFKHEFQRAHDAGFNITIHAGEAAGPESVWEALDLLGAKRIGHGTAAIKDRILMKRLERDQILLECCPYSNYLCNAIDDLKNHPLPRFLESGIPCSISTDDPGLFGKSMPEEVDMMRQLFSFSNSDFETINSYARRHSFIGL